MNGLHCPRRVDISPGTARKRMNGRRHAVGGILWLASYPKSGNTWLRAFLANYLGNAKTPAPINELPKFVYGDGVAAPFEQVAGRSVEGMSVHEIQRLRPKVHEMFVRSRPDTVFVKTHNAIAYLDDIPTITPEATAGAIYVIRNPLDTAISYAHHYGVDFDRAIEVMGSDEMEMPSHAHLVCQYLGSWSSHVRSWTTLPGLHLHVVRYEDMTLKPDKTFRRLVKFLGLPLEPARLKRAIRFSSFKSLASQEKESGFIEAVPIDDRIFFRKGKIGDGRRKLSDAQVQRLIDDHREVMAEHGYLRRDGRPVF